MLRSFLRAGLAAALLFAPAGLTAAAPALPNPLTAPAGVLPCAGANADALSYSRCLTEQATVIDQVRKRMAELENAPPRGGCLGQDDITCIAMATRKLVVSSNPYGPTFTPLKPPERTLDGAPLKRLRYFDVYVPRPGADAVGRQGLDMNLDIAADGGVYAARVELPRPVFPAVSVGDFDETGVYELAAALLGEACVGEDRLAFYRLVRDMLAHERAKDDWADHRVNVISGSREMCGHLLTITSKWTSPSVRRHSDKDSNVLSVTAPPTFAQSVARFLLENPPEPRKPRRHRRDGD